MKCRICRPARGKKQATALHEEFASFSFVRQGVAERRRENNFSDDETDNTSSCEPKVVRRLAPLVD